MDLNLQDFHLKKNRRCQWQSCRPELPGLQTLSELQPLRTGQWLASHWLSSAH